MFREELAEEMTLVRKEQPWEVGREQPCRLRSWQSLYGRNWPGVSGGKKEGHWSWSVVGKALSVTEGEGRWGLILQDRVGVGMRVLFQQQWETAARLSAGEEADCGS